MKSLVQRVSEASVTVGNRTVGAIGRGLLVLLGVEQGDDERAAELLARKVANLPVFRDEAGRMNRSVLDIGGEALVVSQFTLYADTRRGRRPGFTAAALPETAAPLVEAYAAGLESMGVRVGRGRFGAHMQVALENDGPVTIILDSDDLDTPRRSS